MNGLCMFGSSSYTGLYHMPFTDFFSVDDFRWTYNCVALGSGVLGHLHKSRHDTTAVASPPIVYGASVLCVRGILFGFLALWIPNKG